MLIYSKLEATGNTPGLALSLLEKTSFIFFVIGVKNEKETVIYVNGNALNGLPVRVS